MTLSDIANLSTFASALAVAVSLIYLSLQVRQAEKNQRGVMNQGIATRSVSIVQWSAEPHVARLRTRVMQGETDFTAEEITQLSFILRVSMLSFQDNLVQHEAGHIDRVTLENTMGGVRGLLSQLVFRAIWNRIHHNFSEQTTRFVDDLIASTPVEEPVDIVARFKADLAALPR